MRNGYEMLYMPTHHRADSTGCVYEHIVVAEKKLGRELKDDECVHHINEVRNDNREENLIVFKTKADHTAFHHGCEAILDGDIYWCPDKNKDKYRRVFECQSSAMGNNRFFVLRPLDRTISSTRSILPIIGIRLKNTDLDCFTRSIPYPTVHLLLLVLSLNTSE